MMRPNNLPPEHVPAADETVDELALRFHQLQVDRAIDARQDPMEVAIPDRFKDRIRLTPKLCDIEFPDTPEN